jgi:hypothetical protein
MPQRIDVDRGQLAETGHVALLPALGELIAGHVMSGRVIHADDTPVPCSRRARAGQDRSAMGIFAMSAARRTAPSAVLYRYA